MEPISFLLDTFIELVDRIINLEKKKNQDRQQLFNEIVKPLFEELEPIALVYMDFFRRTRSTITRSKKKDLPKIVQNIKKERDAIVMTRIKVSEMARGIRSSVEDDEVVEFAWAICYFLKINLRSL